MIKFRMKKVVSIILALCMVLLAGTSAFASDNKNVESANKALNKKINFQENVKGISKKAESVRKINGKDYKVITITDVDEIKKQGEIHGSEAPEGYKLTKIEFVEPVLDEQVNIDKKEANVKLSSAFSSGISLQGLFAHYYGYNPIVNPIDCYMPDNPMYSDWFDGPGTGTINEMRQFQNTYSATTGLSVDGITTTVGYSVTQTSQHQCSTAVPILADQRLNIKTYSNFQETKYEERYNNGWPEYTVYLVGYRYAYRVLGVKFVNFFYSK